MVYRRSPFRAFSLPISRPEAPLTWTIWWDMHRRPESAGWSRAIENSEEDAVHRAEHFLKLGFIVYAIKDPGGMVFMDETQIMRHFGKVS